MEQRGTLYVPLDMQEGYKLPTSDLQRADLRSATVRLDRPNDIVWQSVREALEDEDWDFRTISGIERATGIADTHIEKLIRLHGEEIRKRTFLDGRVGYTLRTRAKSWRERFSDFLDRIYP